MHVMLMEKPGQKLKYTEVKKPSPKPNEVLIKDICLKNYLSRKLIHKNFNPIFIVFIGVLFTSNPWCY